MASKAPREGAKPRESARSEVNWDPLSGLGDGPAPDEGKEFNPFAGPPPPEVPALEAAEPPAASRGGLNGAAKRKAPAAVAAPVENYFIRPTEGRRLPHANGAAKPPPPYAAAKSAAADAPIAADRPPSPPPPAAAATDTSSAAAPPPPPPPPRLARSPSSNDAVPPAAPPASVVTTKKQQAGPEKTLVNIDRVTFVSMHQDVLHGTLRVTNFRIAFEPTQKSRSDSEQWLFQESSLFDVPLGCVDRISRGSSSQVVGSRSKDSLMVSLVCKDFRKLHFKFATIADASKVHDLVRMSAFPVSEGQGLRWLFALEYGQWVFSKGSEQQHGWRIYDPRKEFARQGLFGPSGTDDAIWRLSEVNRRYQMCPSYPSLLVTPSTISDEELRAVSSFRSKGRIPALSWYSADNKGSIWRSSQPKVGLGNNISRPDERLWTSILERANSVAARIVDCRPYKNALGNKAKGMGYEDEVRYPHTSVSFQNIQNIHTIRGSMEKLLSLVTSSSSSSSSSSSVSSPGHNWLANVEGTGWLNHLRSVLNASITVARYVACNGFPVLVHCSDGWDRTSQVCALAQLLLDPYYRTLEGFPVLVEKEWLSFGYRFMTRTGHGMEGGSEERSPCFLQFIDCVWQLLNQFAPCFEFNEAYLRCILEHLYSCKYGTFLCDNEAERVREAIPLKTISLWDHMAERRDEFINILYAPVPNEITEKIPLLPHPAVVARKVVLWDDYYLRYATTPSLHGHAFLYLGRAKFRRNISSTADKLEASLREAQKEKEKLQAKILALRASVTELSLGERDDDEKSDATENANANGVEVEARTSPTEAV